MEAKTIKWIDYYLGTPLCFLLSLINSLLPKSKVETKKVLFIKLIEQGASVLAYSAIHEAIQKYGKEQVYFIVFKENSPILYELNLLEEKNIITISHDNFFVFLRDIFEAILFIRKYNIDSSIDMEFFSRASVILSFLSGCVKRVGLFRFEGEQPYRGNLISHRVIYNPYLHVSKLYLLLVKALKEMGGSEPMWKHPQEQLQIVHPTLENSPTVLSKLQEKLAGLTASNKYLIINPNAGDMLPLRKWDMEKFGQLSRFIETEYPDYAIIFTGIESEKAAIADLMAQHQLEKGINLAGKTTFKELMCLYELSDLVITNDSGPAHFASMYSTKIIVLFGPETPHLFAPLSNKVHVIYKNLACSPCVNVYNHRFSTCTNNLCMQSITVKEVSNKVKEILK